MDPSPYICDSFFTKSDLKSIVLEDMCKRKIVFSSGAVKFARIDSAEDSMILNSFNSVVSYLDCILLAISGKASNSLWEPNNSLIILYQFPVYSFLYLKL